MNITATKANSDDAQSIAEFNVAMAYETEGKKIESSELLAGVKGLMSKPEYGFYIVAKHNLETVACMMITYEWTDWRNGLFWWIQSVYVKPKYRKQGVYRLMHKYVRELSQLEEDVVGIRLYVEKENENAIKVYKRMGMYETDYKLFEELLKKDF